MKASPAVGPPTLELLAWVSTGPRTYRETIEAWRTSCPRLSVWDDAIADGLVEVRRDGVPGEALVGLTTAGKATLVASSRARFHDLALVSPGDDGGRRPAPHAVSREAALGLSSVVGT